MNTDEQIGLVPVGDISSFVQFNKNIGSSGIDDPDIRKVLLDKRPKLQRNRQCYVFFL